MTGEVIKSFLVSLGFGVDDSSLGKFNKSIESASVRVLALYGSVKIAAAGIFYGIAQISQGFEDMGYEMRIVAPAINKALLLRNALLGAYKAAGVNITKVVQESIKFNMSLTKTRFALEAVYKSVASRFFPMLTKQMDIFRSKIYANMPRIQAVLEKFVNFVFKAFSITVQLGERIWSILSRVYDFFERLHKATDGWSTVIVGLIAAWKILNLSFLATPLGMLLAGFLALLAVYDDFKTAQEGGKSFFNWKDGPMIKLVELFKTLWDLVRNIGAILGDISNGENNWGKLAEDIGKVASAFWSLNGAVDALVKSFHSETLDKIMAWRDRVDDKVFSAFGGGSGQYFNQGNFAAAPLGVGTGSAGNSQSMNMQTNIVVNGTSDPVAAGNQVLGGQRNVNADAARNLKGAVR